MATNEKKFSDFQNNECESVERVGMKQGEVVEANCPTCTPNPNFKLPGIWYNIKKPYLNEKFCEYHVLVTKTEADEWASREKRPSDSQITDNVILTGIDKLLIFFDKLNNNDSIRTIRESTKIIKENSLSSNARGLNPAGRNYLVSVPAQVFNLIPNLPKEESKLNKSSSGEKSIVLKVDGLFRKFVQLQGALIAYQSIYSMLANDSKDGIDGGGFHIYEEDNPTRRLNFNSKIKEFKEFRQNLNEALYDAGTSRIGYPDILRQRTTKIKFLFEDGDGYVLRRLMILPEKCPDEYIPINLGDLGNGSYDFSFNLLNNLEMAIKDITATETKPWLEFVTDYFYPAMAVDYGNLASMDADVRSSLGCLADKYFGSGQLANSAGEILNAAFDKMLQDAYDAACLSIQEVSVNGPEARMIGKVKRGKSSVKEGKDKAKQAYIKFVIQQIESSISTYNESETLPCQEIVQVPEPEPIPQPVAEEPVEQSEPVENPPQPPPTTGRYEVVKGDTLYGISKKYNISIQDLVRLNPQFDISKLPEWSSDPQNQFYGVPEGETAETVSGRNPNWIFPGEMIIVNKESVQTLTDEEVDQFLSEISELDPSDFEEDNTTSQIIPEDSTQQTENNTTTEPIVEQSPEADQATEQTEATPLTDRKIFEKYLSILSVSPDPKCLTFKVKVVNSTSTQRKIIRDYDALEVLANDYANHMFSGEARDWGFGADGEIKKAWSAAFDDENTIIGLIKNYDDIDSPSGFWPGLINIIGLCGMSKLADSALKCLLGGITINQFYDIMINKFFEFIDFSMFDLFLNELPYSFRQELNAAIAKEFGPDVSITDLINVKAQREQKLGNVVNFSIIGQMKHAIETSGGNKSSLSQDQIELLNSNVGPAAIDGLLNLHSDDRLRKEIKNSRNKYLKNSGYFTESNKQFTKAFNVFKNANALGLIGTENTAAQQAYLDAERSAYEKMAASMEESNIGKGLDIVFDVILGFLVDYIIESISADALVEIISQFPGGDFLVGVVTNFFKSCPHPGIFKPPVKDFIKSFNLDVCDPLIDLSLPRLIIPNLNLRYQLIDSFANGFMNALEQLFIQLVVDLIKRLAKFLEDLLCKALEAVGQLTGDWLKGDLSENGFLSNLEKAIDEAFCGGAKNPKTGESRAKELSKNLIEGKGQNYAGMADTATNIISSVASAEELLQAIANPATADEGTSINDMIVAAINSLAPELNPILGTPSMVAYFFENLGSFLSEEDKSRILEMLDRGVPSIPITATICLTDDFLNSWNSLRKNLIKKRLQDEANALNPEDFYPTGGEGGDIDGQIEEDVDNMNSEIEDSVNDLLDDVLNLQSDSPFASSLTNSLMRDLCDPKNTFNINSKSEFEKEEDEEEAKEEFKNTKNILAYGMTSKDGVLGYPLRDKNHKYEFDRKFQKLVNPNYTNSTKDRNLDYESAGPFTKSLMDLLPNDSGSNYPTTVALKLKELVDGDSIMSENMPNEISINFIPIEGSDYSSSIGLLNFNEEGFDLTVQKTDSINLDNYSFDVPMSLTDDQKDSISEFSDGLEQTVFGHRFFLFRKYVMSKIGDNISAYDLYSSMSSDLSSRVIKQCFKDSRDEKGLSDGFKFGYVSNELSESYYKYEPSGEEGKLGKFGDDRIIPLNPEIYGGSYENPPFTVKPRNFYGWLGYSLNMFDTPEGCTPSNKPIMNLDEIRNKVIERQRTLRDHPDLSRDPACTSEKPFKLLANKEIRAEIEGVVKTTLKTYALEYFLFGAPIFSNVHYRKENYGNIFSRYVTRTMKFEMLELGSVIPLRQISISKHKYWYAFMEQCVEIFNTMVNSSEIIPTQREQEILQQISFMQKIYQGVTANIKLAMVNEAKRDNKIKHPLVKPTGEEREALIADPVKFARLSMAFRLKSYNDSFYGENKTTTVTKDTLYLSSLKKLQFHAKMYAISLYEDECMEIVSKLISLELEDITRNAYNPNRITTNVYDLKTAFLGFSDIFDGTESKIGFTDFYSDFKTTGKYEPGNIRDYEEVEKEHMKYVVEKYIRVVPKEDTTNPLNLRTEEKMKIIEFSSAIDELDSEIQDKYFSNFFGDLDFVYKSKISEIFSLENFDFSLLEDVMVLNPNLEESVLQGAYESHILRDSYDDFEINHRSNLLPDIEQNPIGTTGDLGIFYGVRVGVYIDKLFQTEGESDIIFLEIANSEVSLVDSKISEFNLEQGKNMFDLECLINKVTQTKEYKMFFDLIFPLEAFCGLSALYCSENFMPSIGYGSDERNDVDNIEFNDPWEGSTNQFVKGYMRRQFASLYLANGPDGFKEEDESSNERMRLFGSFNPFDYLSLPNLKIPWWYRKRLLTKVLDREGEDCANPLKDFE